MKSSFRHVVVIVAIQVVVNYAQAASFIAAVALSGGSPPGVPSGVSFAAFGLPIVNNNGQVLFEGVLAGSGVSDANDRGIWSGFPTSLTLGVREGDQAPGATNGVNFRRFTHASFNNAGQVAVSATLTTNDDGIWSTAGGVLAKVAMDGDQAPGMPTGVKLDLPTPTAYVASSNLGSTAFSSGLTGPGVSILDNTAVFAGSTGSVIPVARSGNQAPGAPVGALFDGFDAPTLSGSGTIAFSATLRGSGIGYSDACGIWSGPPENIDLAIREGDSAPGTPSGVKFANLSSLDFHPVLGNSGRIAFVSTLTGPGVVDSNSTGIWTISAEGVELVVREGDPAPGVPAGAWFDDLHWGGMSNLPKINDTGQITFGTTLAGSGVDGSNDVGVWSGTADGLQLIARKGDPAPGTPAGVSFGWSRVDEFVPTLNDAGQVAFLAALTGPGVSSANDRGIWATSPSGALELVIREGDVLEVGPGLFRTVAGLYFASATQNSFSPAASFNNLGQLAFWAAFTDGSSGLFVAEVPEPASLLLLVLGGLAVMRRRVRRIAVAAIPVVLTALLLSATSARAVNIETVPVGNPGNAGELSGESVPGGYGPDRICGAVDYVYNIAKYEVTTGQYCAFLNAVARTDTYGLYNTEMWWNQYGCKIERTGSSGNYSYSVAADWANRPVNYVSWGDAMRFSNWLHNEQPTGNQGMSTTEDGAYYLNGARTDAELLSASREADWKWAITTEDEWYKAAYHKNDGATGNYFDYPTSSDSEPSNALDGSGNNATYFVGDPAVGGPYFRTEAGAHENSESPYGTFDMGGNVWEWVKLEGLAGYELALRGGSFYNYGYTLRAAFCNFFGHNTPTWESNDVGFRVVQVPEPAALLLLALGGMAVMRRRS